MWFKTKEIALTKGVAIGGSSLNAFDNAMRSALIADFNIIRVTSIVPPHVKVRNLKAKQVINGRGRMLPAVYANIECSEIGTRISAGVGIGIPADQSKYSGVIFTATGFVSATTLRSNLRKMIDEGMREMRLVKKYVFKSAIATTEVAKPVTSVFAAAAFFDQDLLQIESAL